MRMYHKDLVGSEINVTLFNVEGKQAMAGNE